MPQVGLLLVSHRLQEMLAKDCSCIAVGEYCGCYVWVLPEGQDQLTKLTLAILDYAMHEPPVKAQQASGLQH